MRIYWVTSARENKTLTTIAANTRHNPPVMAIKLTSGSENPDPPAQSATLLRRQARALRREADQLDHDAASITARRAGARRRQAIATSGPKVHKLILDGITEPRAVVLVAMQIDCPPESVAGAWTRWRRSSAEYARFQRNREIMRLAGHGWTNAALATRFALSSAMVSKIIASAIKQRHRVD